ncbi:MAG: DUF6484 domain-containing protein [Candidatus Thiodiazotropha sp.]
MSKTLNDPKQQAAAQDGKLDGVVIGILVGMDPEGKPRVVFPGNPQEDALSAKSTLSFQPQDLGKEVALLFENGDPQRPLIIGRLQHPRALDDEASGTEAELDGERLVLSAEREIVLKCGKASITLTRAGKIILRGASILSRSSGLNRIKGGSVQIN